MANLRRRSARLSKADSNQSSARKTPLKKAQLESLVERDETPDTVPQSIDDVLTTPATSRTTHEQLLELDTLRTPQTEPRPEHVEMNPKSAHRSTAKAPDSGLKLGFSDIKKDKTHDTPTKSASRQSVPAAAAFEFKFSSDSHLSRDAQKLMDNVREDAARIKAQMVAERAAQEQKDKETDTMFGAGRKIAQPRGKAGRFSDVHMAQFKKMDSIENHASAFRARPGFAAPTTQSLKRSPSKAELDEPERPRTAGKVPPGQTRRIPPPVIGRPNSTSPFKSIPRTAELRSTPGPSKRPRQSEHQDVSDSRPVSAIPRLKSSTLCSPTKSSLARTSQTPGVSEKPSAIPRSSSVKSTRPVQIPKSDSEGVSSPLRTSPSKPLPPLPAEANEPLYPELPSSPVRSIPVATGGGNFVSKLPTLSGLKSILRSGRKTTTAIERPATPKRPNTAHVGSDSPKKVDFTPSVKSRHAVKLAASSPSPAKVRRDTPYKASDPIIPYDSSAYTIGDDEDQEWEDEDSEITYPALPPAQDADTAVHNFSSKAQEMNRRESKEFKSIFTTLHPTRSSEPTTLTSINTTLNKTNPEAHADQVARPSSNLQTMPSPSTIRRVRTSGATTLIQPFEDKIKTVPHGLPGKKRRHESINENDKHGTDEDAKENRRISEMPVVPGGWDDNVDEEHEEESNTRAGKRARVLEKSVIEKQSVKKPNAAREAAAKNAKERKGRGVLSLSRLNMLSRPKSRG